MGILFFEVFFPLLNTCTEVLSTWLETKKAKFALKITEMNSKIKQIAEDEGYPEKKRAIGFQSESIEEELEPFEDEDDVDEDD